MGHSFATAAAVSRGNAHSHAIGDGAVIPIGGGGTGATTVAAARAALEVKFHNLCLNPSFESILLGTHTSAITTLTGSITTKNCQFPGWKLKTLHADDSIVVVPETSIISPSGSQQSIKATIANVTGKPQLVQYWTAAESLSKFVAGTIGRYFTFAVDIRQSEVAVDAARLFVTTDGGGVATTYSSYHTNADDTWERLLASVLVPAATTYIYFGISFESTTPLYYIDNAMVTVSDAALTALPYQPRPPMRLAAPPLNTPATNVFTGLTAPSAATSYVTGVANAALPTYNSSYNALRPAWADRASVVLDADNGNAVEDYFIVRPNGYNTGYYTAIARIQVVGKIMSISGEVVLGADGELQVLCSHGDVDGYVTVSSWYGEGL